TSRRVPSSSVATSPSAEPRPSALHASSRIGCRVTCGPSRCAWPTGSCAARDRHARPPPGDVERRGQHEWQRAQGLGYIFSAMKAAVLHGPRTLRVEGAPTPGPAPGEALVRVAVAGLCGTDYSIFSGERAVDYPRVMGHEFVGRIEAVGSGVTAPRVGDRVAIEPNYSCGVCALCPDGNRNLCLRRAALGIDVYASFAA